MTDTTPFPLGRTLFMAVLLALSGCGAEAMVEGGDDMEAEPEDDGSNREAQGLVTCGERADTGYTSGRAFPITVVNADGKPVERDTANAYAVMQAAAARSGIGLRVVSGFRTMAEQQHLYQCYRTCSCNSCNLAASPGYSNHQSGHALDLNTSDGGVYSWLTSNAARFGFRRTVPSEAWHWEWWGGGPGGGPCGAAAPEAPPPPPKPVAKYEVLTGDFNGDHKADVLTISPNAGGGWADWAALELSSGGGFVSTVWPTATTHHMRNGGAESDYRVLTGDFNGDGKTDLATITRDGGGGWSDWVALELSTGSGFTSTVWRASTPQHMRNGGSGADYRVLAADFNGDGKTDLATITRDGGGGWADWVAMELSTGSGFVSQVWRASTPQHMRNGGSGADYRVVAADFDGDGRADLATLSPTGGGAWNGWYAMELSTGSGFNSTVWPSTTPQHIRNGGATADYRVLVGDFNGDHRADVAVLSPTAGGGWADWLAIDLSTGNGFSYGAWGAATPQHMRNGGALGLYRVVTGDFNGDGKTDVLTSSAAGGGAWNGWDALELSTGSGFASTVWTTPTPQHMRNGGAGSDYRVLAADLNGDGRTDLATVGRNSGGGWHDWAAIDLSTGGGFSSGTWGCSTPAHMRNGEL